MKSIPATLGYTILVDDEDFNRLSQHRWYAHNTGGRGTSEKRPARRTGRAEGRKVLFLVHHIVRAPHGMVIDHINGDPWDNRRSNLRICTHSENMRNRRKHGGSCKNEYKGVYRRNGRWIARICVDTVVHNLGSYDASEDAARAYDDAAAYLHGEFARLNFADRKPTPRAPGLVKESAPSAERGRDYSVALEAIRAGATAVAAAKGFGVHHAHLCNLAKRTGIALTRGRPRKRPSADASAGKVGAA